MFDLAVKNLWARKTRTVLVVLAVAVCVFLINTVDGMLSNMNADRARDLDRQSGSLYLRQAGSGYPPFGSTMPESTAARAVAHPAADPSRSTPLLLTVIVPPDDPMVLAEVLGVGLVPGAEAAYLGAARAATGSVSLLGAGDNALILGALAAKYYDVGVGDTVNVNGEPGSVTGVIERRGIENVDDAVLMALPFAQRAFGREGLASVAMVKPRDAAEAATLAADLSAWFPRLEVAIDADIRDEVGRTMDMPNRFMGMISWTVFVVAIVMVTNVMLTAVRERTREFGTLAALGARPVVVLMTVMMEAFILMAIGGAVGISAAVPAAHMMGWTWVLSVQEVLKVGVLVVVGGGLAALYPAYRATRISPVEALRYE